ncbi:MAG TPA: HAD family hydrolase [Ktedonobacterales bacterium]|jgi:FMN phosphatase YigB (HAD superfamily)
MPIPSLAFLIDVDNTLLDNDKAKDDQAAYLRDLLGEAAASRFWELYEEVRREADVVDYPLTLARFAREFAGQFSGERLFQLSNYYLSFPFRAYLYPEALETLAYLRTLGTTAITSDGDASFQGLKIVRSGISAAVQGRVALYLHKEEHVDEIRALFPAEHYVMIDDKPTLLSAMKSRMGESLTTVHVRQGKYARVMPARGEPPADLSIATIREARQARREQFEGQGASAR